MRDAARAGILRFPAADEEIERQVVRPARQQQPRVGEEPRHLFE